MAFQSELPEKDDLSKERLAGAKSEAETETGSGSDDALTGLLEDSRTENPVLPLLSFERSGGSSVKLQMLPSFTIDGLPSRPDVCVPGDPNCDPRAKKAEEEDDQMCRPGDPECDPDAVLEVRAEIKAEIKAGEKQEKEVCAPGDPSCDPGARVKRDGTGAVVDINYPDGKKRHIGRDEKGNVNSIQTTDRDGTTNLVNRDGNWFLKVQGMELPFAGKVQVEDNGDCCIQMGADGVWRREKPDGTVTSEKENSDGSRVGLGPDGAVERVSRRDGYNIRRVSGDTIVESRPGQDTMTWKRDGDIWTADKQGEKPRKSFVLTAAGAVSYEDQNGIKHTVNGAGAEILEGQGLAKLQIDESGRIKESETPDGKKSRKYDFFENSNDVKTVTITDKTTGQVSTFTRESKDSREWKLTDGNGHSRGTWRGDVRVSPEGIHSIRTAATDYYGRPVAPGPNDRWTSYHPDGKETKDTFAEDGSRTSYNDKNEVVSLRTTDGLKIDRSGDSIKVFDPKIGQTVTWTRGDGGAWRSDSDRMKDVRKDLAFNEKGEFTFARENGDKVLLHRDNSKDVTRADGTKLTINQKDEITKAVKGNLTRTFDRNEAGEIQSVRDFNSSTKEEKVVFGRKAEETRKNIAVSENGDFSYSNPDGSAVIERSNMVRLELDKDGDTVRASNSRFSREFKYIGQGQEKQLAGVVDTRNTDKGPKVDTWTRVAGADGTLSNEFHSKTPDGKERKPRSEITVCADGEYEFRSPGDKPGDKLHVARLSGLGEGGIFDSVEDAHYELLSNLEGKMDKPRAERFERMMKQYEQRMSDQLELLIASGVDEEAARKDVERSVSECYHHVGRLCGEQGKKPIYDQSTRLRLAENVLYHAADPSTIKQGNTGTCWWESSWNVGMFQRNVNHAARLVADVALTGEYTSTGAGRDGRRRHVRVPEQYVQIGRGSDSGSRWNVDNAHTGSHRSPVAMLIDQVGPPVNGARGWGRSNAGGHGEARNILKLLTGRDDIRHGSDGIGRHEKLQLLKTGGFTASGGGHMWAYTMQKRNGAWNIIRDDQYEGRDRVVAVVRDLRKWLTSDVKEDVRRNWRPFRPGGDNSPPDTQPEPDDNRPSNPPQYRPYRPFRPRWR